AGFRAPPPAPALAAAAFPRGVGRMASAPRRAAVVDRRDPAAAADTLARRAPGRVVVGTRPAGRRAPPVVFLFPRPGTQTVGMAAAVYRTQPAVPAQLDPCCDPLAPPPRPHPP